MNRDEALLIFGMFLVTFGVRYPVLAFVSRIELPGIIRRSLRYIPAAVLSAIIAPAVFVPGGANLDLGLGNTYLIAGAAAALISWRTKNLLLTILLGMAVFLGLRLLL